MLNIKYFAFSKQSLSLPIYAYAPQKLNEDDHKAESVKVLSQLKSFNLRSDERMKISSSYGCWYCKKDSKGIIYFVLCSSNYPQRHIMSAINQLRDHLLKLGQYEFELDAALKKQAKEPIQQICTKFEDVKNIDKIGQINKNIDEIRKTVQLTTRGLMENSIELEGLEKKAEDLKMQAGRFQENAQTLKKQMWCKNCKLKILIAVVIAVLLTVIIVPIVTR